MSTGCLQDVDLNVKGLPLTEIDKANNILELLCQCYANLRKNWADVDVVGVQVIQH